MQSRRSFIKRTAMGAAGLTIGLNSKASLSQSEAKAQRPIHVFTKCLQFLSYEEMAKVLSGHGFDGADLAVRTGGQILPENVEKDLPKAMKALKNEGIGTSMITTRINDPNHPATRPILKTMADLGIKYYRMGYLIYDDKKTIPENLDELKFKVENLEKLNREYGVTAQYQNHSGTRVGGPVWDLYELVKERDPEYIGIQYDIRHATVEGGVSWPIGMKLLAPWIRTTDIKDFIWEKNKEGVWQIKNVPLGEGMVDFRKYFDLYKSLKIQGPVSIHYEYDMGGAEKGKTDITMSREKIYEYLKRDLDFLKEQFKKYSL